jgi:hypothetical protein
MEVNYQQWMLLQEKSDLFLARSASVWCDRRQHLLILNYPADKNASVSSAGSTLSLTDHSSVISGYSTKTVDAQIVSKYHFRLNSRYLYMDSFEFVLNVLNIYNEVVGVLLVVQRVITISFELFVNLVKVVDMVLSKNN